MTKDMIRAIFKEVTAEMQTHDVRVNLRHKSLDLKSWREVAYEMSNRGLDAETKRDGVIFDGGHLEARLIEGGANVALILHDDGDVMDGVDTFGESFQVRRGKALMPHDAGDEEYPATALCIERDHERLCLSADDVGRLAYMIREIHG